MSIYLADVINNYRVALIVLPVIALLSVFLTIKKTLRLIEAKSHLDNAMIMVPLYKNNFWIVFVGCLVTLLGLGGVIYGALCEGVELFVCLFVICLSVTAIALQMATFRTAIIDSGVVVPYRFISWHELYDYIIVGNKIVFSGDKHGRSTLSSTTIELLFNPADLTKLQIILEKNKVKRKPLN